MVIQEQYRGLKNNMKVTLKAYTQPVDSNLEASEFIAYCARVSNPSIVLITNIFLFSKW